MIINVIQLYEIVLTIGRRRIHASISFDMTSPYNNNIKTIYDILKALPFNKCVA